MKSQSTAVELSLADLELVAGGTTPTTSTETPPALRAPQMAAAGPVSPPAGDTTDMPVRGV